MDIKTVLDTCNKNDVRYLRLQFTDILGMNKNVEVPSSQFERALNGEIYFDGSSIEGFARIEESDMMLIPDLSTFRILPWSEEGCGKEARVMCDIYSTDKKPYEGCARGALKRILHEAEDLGFSMMVGPEIEFFLFQRDKHGEITTDTHDRGGYFDLTPVDRGETARRRIVEDLEKMGFEIEASHHEVASAQHEIDFKYDEALRASDNICTFRFVVRKIAMDYNLHATFMPKPIYGELGSGMHTNQSLFRDGKNCFVGDTSSWGLSDLALNYIGGLMHHADAITAITNPLINSYKRLVPGFEAPTTIAWARRNRSPLIRVPDARGQSTRIELRSPDPSCNPYLANAVILAAGLDGIKKKIDPGAPLKENIYDLDPERKNQYRQLPGSLAAALDAFEKSDLMKKTLGEHIFTNYLRAKRSEWSEYVTRVHQWEIDQYLGRY
ncbi:MAG: type I glutamate--ammonia ligase [Deltaproteobacteria bacterium]|nr:type I glutamate--ammonia ligase [Deltaproteobacteria bacterium]